MTSAYLDKRFYYSKSYLLPTPAGEGTGLGLSLTLNITKAIGGELKVVTEEHKFARFVITLPL